MKLSVTVILRNPQNQYLLVSRKTDHTRFTLPGGKVDPGEDIDQAVIRETREETGLDIFNLNLVAITEDEVPGQTNQYRQYCFTADYSGKDDFDGVSVFDPVRENHIVKWGSPEQLFANPTMGLYNQRLFTRLTLTGTL